MEPKEPGRIRGCLGALANGANDLLLLLRVQFGRATHLDPAISALVRSRTIDRSNSAKLPSICIIMRPAAVVVSTASVRLRKPAPASRCVTFWFEW